MDLPSYEAMKTNLRVARDNHDTTRKFFLSLFDPKKEPERERLYRDFLTYEQVFNARLSTIVGYLITDQEKAALSIALIMKTDSETVLEYSTKELKKLGVKT